MPVVPEEKDLKPLARSRLCVCLMTYKASYKEGANEENGDWENSRQLCHNRWRGGMNDCINIDLRIRLCNLSTQDVIGRSNVDGLFIRSYLKK